MARGFRMGRGAVFVWEGVIGYIDRTMIDRSLRFMARAGGPGTRVAFTFADSVFDPDPALAVVKAAGFDALEARHLGDVWKNFWPSRGEAPPNLIVTSVGCASVAS